MRRGIGAGVVFAVLGLATGAIAVLTPHGAPAMAAGVTTFTATDFVREILDTAPKGLSLGDRVLLSSTLSNPAGAGGFSGVECVVTAVRPGSTDKGRGKPKATASSACVGTIETTAGLIAAQSLSRTVYAGDAVEMAITGGSGEYEGAVGTLVLGSSAKTASRVMLTLR